MLRFETWTKESEILQRFQEENEKLKIKSVLDEASQFLSGPCRPIYKIPRPLIKRKTKENEIEYIHQDFCWKPRICYCCGCNISSWTLFGGGYEENWFAAILRETLPIVICETCFRVNFLKEPDPVVEVGIAVLPEVEKRSTRSLEVERYIISKRKEFARTNNPVSLDKLTTQEISFYLAAQVLFRYYQIDANEILVLYSFTKIRDEGITIYLSKKQTSLLGVLGFVEDTQVEVCSNFSKVIRKLQDFHWLEFHLRNLDSSLPFLISSPLILGYFNESFFETRVQTLVDFLKFVCLNEPWKSALPLRLFFRPAFDVAKAIVETEREIEQEDLTIKRVTRKLQNKKRSFRNASYEINPDFDKISRILTEYQTIENNIFKQFEIFESVNPKFVFKQQQEDYSKWEDSITQLIHFSKHQQLNLQRIQDFLNV